MKMTAKLLTKVIHSCSYCPYCNYDPYYSRTQVSGYDCVFNGCRRIINDWEWDNPGNPNRLNLKYDDIPIPDWCPLPDTARVRYRGKSKVDKEWVYGQLLTMEDGEHYILVEPYIEVQQSDCPGCPNYLYIGASRIIPVYSDSIEIIESNETK